MAPAPAAERKTVKIKKSVSDEIRRLNAEAGLLAELRLGAVATQLAKLEEADALEVLAKLVEEAGTIDNPTAWVLETAKAKVASIIEIEMSPGNNGGAGEASFGGGSRPPERPGDWNCPNCGDLQFARNATCRQCGAPRPDGVAPSEHPNARPGDWECPSCHDLQFARNAVCRQCRTPKPVSRTGEGYKGEMKPGDWICPGCQDLQFAKNKTCRRCDHPKPPEEMWGGGCVAAGCGGYGGYGDCGGYGGWSGGWGCGLEKGCGFEKGGKAAMMKPGDWFCPTCGDLQFAKNQVCRQCQTPNPEFAWGGGGWKGGPSVWSGGGDGGKGMSGVGGAGKGAMRPGDWYCPSCGDLQFAKNTVCRRCNAAKPEDSGFVRQGGLGGAFPMKPGDWVCPQCGDTQFARNVACRKCNAPKPEEAEQHGGYDEPFAKKQKMGNEW